MQKTIAKNTSKFPAPIFIGAIFIIMIISSVYLVNEANKRLSISNKKNYIERASANLISLNQSIEEVISATAISQSSYAKVLANADFNKSINYQPLIEDNQKTLHQINLVSENLGTQKENITKENIPPDYLLFKEEFLNYYSQSEQYLDDLEKKFEFESVMLNNLASSQVENLTQTNIWASNDKQVIIDFFKKLNTKSQENLTRLTSLNLPSKYQSYYSLQLNYLELVASASSEIINLLNLDDGLAVAGDVTNLENAYKIAQDSQNNLEIIAGLMVSQRNEYFSLAENESQLNNLTKTQNQLESTIKNSYQSLYIQSK